MQRRLNDRITSYNQFAHSTCSSQLPVISGSPSSDPSRVTPDQDVPPRNRAAALSQVKTLVVSPHILDLILQRSA